MVLAYNPTKASRWYKFDTVMQSIIGSVMCGLAVLNMILVLQRLKDQSSMLIISIFWVAAWSCFCIFRWFSIATPFWAMLFFESYYVCQYLAMLLMAEIMGAF